MPEPVWLPNYVDLSDGDTMRLGAECAVCGARYTTPPETIDPLLATAALPGSSLERDLAELRFQFFARFDAAFREICVTCYRCGQAACPDCWDEDNRMCGACVARRGLVRSPHHGLPVTGPLVDGRLVRVAAGQYGEAGRPRWLSQLLDAQAALVAAGGSGESGEASAGNSLPQGIIAPQIARRESQGPATSGAADVFRPLESSRFGREGSGSLVEEPTLHHSVVEDLLPSGRRIYSAGPALAPETSDFQTPEGTATSNMVTCPRCGTPNYDFVTRCTACQLQLIQICPLCEKLNPGHVQRCEHCGSPLQQPKGWSAVQAAIQAVPADEVREIQSGRRTTGAPLARLPAAPPVQRAPRSSRKLRALVGAASGDGAAGPAERRFGDTSGERMRMANITLLLERMLSFALTAAILLVIVGIAAAELSAQVNHFIASIIHVNVRETLAQFLQRMQLLLQQSKR